MKILSHRGYWKTPAEKNTTEAFARSFKMGFGTETDLRDSMGKLVVSHDPPTSDALDAGELLKIHTECDPGLTLALNIKSDGLQGLVKEVITKLKDAFLFDMSVPDAVQWLRSGVPIFTRHSDVEEPPALYKEASGVWLDGFYSDWWSLDVIRRHFDSGKRVCIVSSELHGREHRYMWDRLLNTDIANEGGCMLCTDFPEEARELFDHGH